MPRPAVLACAAASVLAARLATDEFVAPCLAAAWAWIWWLGVRPPVRKAVRHFRRQRVLRWAFAPLVISVAWWGAVWAGAFDRAGTLALTRWMPARYLQRAKVHPAEQARVLASIREQLRRSARAAREGATE